VGVEDPAGAGDPVGAGEVLAADGETAGAAEEGVAVGAAVGDMAVDGVAVALGAVAGVEEAAAGAADMLGVAGAELAGDIIRPDTAWSECIPGLWCEDAAQAAPPTADAASSPATIAATASGRARRR
jgi:hypothetical protein